MSVCASYPLVKSFLRPFIAGNLVFAFDLGLPAHADIVRQKLSDGEWNGMLGMCVYISACQCANMPSCVPKTSAWFRMR